MKKEMAVSINGIVVACDKMEKDNGRVYVWRKNIIVFSFNPELHQLTYFGQSELIHFDLIRK